MDRNDLSSHFQKLLKTRNLSRIPVRADLVGKGTVLKGAQPILPSSVMANSVSPEETRDKLGVGNVDVIRRGAHPDENQNQSQSTTKFTQDSCEAPDSCPPKILRSCAAFFPNSSPSLAIKISGETAVKPVSETIELKNEERYPTKFLHRPPEIYSNRALESVNDSGELLVASPLQKTYQCGGVVIEEVFSDTNIHQKASSVSVQDSHAIFTTGATGTATATQHLKSANTDLAGSYVISKGMVKMPPIPEDTIVQEVPKVEEPVSRAPSSTSTSLTSSVWAPREKEREGQKERIPSFHTVNTPKLPPPNSSERRAACFPSLIPKPMKKLPIAGKSASSEKRNTKVIPFKPASQRRTYEETFLRRKAFAEGGPAALRPFNRETISYFPNEGRVEFQTEQKAVLTKVVTKTVTEYEVDEQGREKKISTKSKSKSKPVKDPVQESPDKSNLDGSASKGKKTDKTKKVTIVDEHPTSNNQEEDKRAPAKQTNSKKRAKSAGEVKTNEPSSQSLDKKEERVPRKVLLRGHGKRKMEMPPVRSRSEDSISEWKEKGREGNEGSTFSGPCKKCRMYKSLLNRCEETVRYLTELLGIKENELELLTERITGGLDDASAILSHVLRLIRIAAKDPYLNPLIARIQLPGLPAVPSSKPTPTNSNSPPKPSSPQLPKFDMDEFIQKFFRHYILCSDEFLKKENIAPFDSTMLFRFVVAARDSISHEALFKMKQGFVELQKRYDNLMKSRSSPEETLNEERMMFVLDSYRRFVRFMYIYMRESLKSLEAMEKTTLPINPNKSEEGKLKQKLHYQTKMVLDDGVQYHGVFIPFSPVVSETPDGTNRN